MLACMGAIVILKSVSSNNAEFVYAFVDLEINKCIFFVYNPPKAFSCGFLLLVEW